LADAASASGSGVGVGATTTGPSVSFDAATDSSAGHHHPPGLAKLGTKEAAVGGGRRWGGPLLLFLSALGAVAVGLPVAVALVLRAYSASPPSSSPHWYLRLCSGPSPSSGFFFLEMQETKISSKKRD
jgi:hypothetical protein